METLTEHQIIELVALAQEKNNNAFDKLMIYYRPVIMNLIHRCVWDKSIVEDCYQEILIRIYLGLPSFRGNSRFFTWIYRISLNVVHDYSKHSLRQSIPIESSYESMSYLPGRYRLREYTTPESLLYGSEVEEYFYEVLNKMSDESVEAIRMYDIEGNSYGQIAEQLNCPESTIRSRISRARAHIDQQMKTFLRYC